MCFARKCATRRSPPDIDQPVKLCPVPQPRIPLLVGGHARPALRRAARLGDGWISAGSSLEELQEKIGQIEGFRKEFGRTEHPFEPFDG